MLRAIVENKTFKVDQMRIPIDGKFKDTGKKGKFNGKINITYALSLDGYWEDNLKAFHEFVFLDGQEEENAEVENGTGATGGTPAPSPSAAAGG